MAPLRLLTLIGAVFADDYIRQDAACYLPIDMVFLQDSTGSFYEDIPNVVASIPTMLAAVESKNGNSLFAAADFKDKPWKPLGEADDFCYRKHCSMTNDAISFEDCYKSIIPSGGQDLPEAMFQSLIDVAYDTSIGWRKPGRAEDGTEAGARVVVMSTDAQPHMAGDMAKIHAIYPDVPLLPPNDGAYHADDWACTNMDYPTPEEVKAALKANNVYLAILVPDDNAAVVSAWRWFSETLLEQPEDFLQIIKNDSSNLITGVLKALDSVTETVCAMTTTPSPTTTTTTTESTTTTSTTPEPTTTTITTTSTTPEPTTTTTTTTSTTPEPTTTTTTTTSTTPEPEPTTTTTTTTSTTPEPTTTTTTTTSTTPETTTTVTFTTTSTTPERTHTTEEPIATPTRTLSPLDPTSTVTETSTSSSASDECPPCPPEEECPCQPKLLVKLYDRPKKFVVDYEA